MREPFAQHNYQQARSFASFLPGVAGLAGKPMWAFYTNRGQCMASFGVRDREAAMLEFHPANKAYTLTGLLGFRTFIRLEGSTPSIYEPFAPAAGAGQTLIVRAHEIEIEDVDVAQGLRTRVVYHTLPDNELPALVRRVEITNIGSTPLTGHALDGLPQVAPYGLNEALLKQLSRTMEAFAEVRHAEANLPFFKLKVEPGDEPGAQAIEAGFFAFTHSEGRQVPLVVDPDQVFGQETGLRTPQAFLACGDIDPARGRRETLTACAFARLALSLAPGQRLSWQSCFGEAPDWQAALRLQQTAGGDASFLNTARLANAQLVSELGAPMALVAGPAILDAYSRQAGLDNTLRGGLAKVIKGSDGAAEPRVLHVYTRKHGDMERDYNRFVIEPTPWSQGPANFRDVNQNRRSENFFHAGLDRANIQTFFNLLQLDGHNPLVVLPESFRLPEGRHADLERVWPAGLHRAWLEFLSAPFTAGALIEALRSRHQGVDAQQLCETIIGLCDVLPSATHGEGYWVDHWIYNLDLLQSYEALYPDRMNALMFDAPDYVFYDDAWRVRPRDEKYHLRSDGTVRQLDALAHDPAKAARLLQRTRDPHLVRVRYGQGEIYRTTLLVKLLSLLAIKSALFDPFGAGLEMDAGKPGWCDALNGLPGLFGSSTHEAFALGRGLSFVGAALDAHAGEQTLLMPVEVSALIVDLTAILSTADPAFFFPTWQALAGRRERFRAEVHAGLDGAEVAVSFVALRAWIEAVTQTLARGLYGAVDAAGLPVSYFTHAAATFDELPVAPVVSSLVSSLASPAAAGDKPPPATVRVHAFSRHPLPPFLEGAVHAMRSADSVDAARRLYRAVRASDLYDAALGMYRVNAPLEEETTEIGRIRVFTPGWLENASIFLHMHYKFLLEALRSGLAEEFFSDFQRGVVAFHDPAVYGRSPLENSSFIASSRFSDPASHGQGFVSRLSGATAEWISMVLHMGLGAAPFRVEAGELRFAPQPVLVDWLFTGSDDRTHGADRFGFRLFDTTWVTYVNPLRRSTFGVHAVAPVAFELTWGDGRVEHHADASLGQAGAMALRQGQLVQVVIRLG
jgi:hypothetical protein